MKTFKRLFFYLNSKKIMFKDILDGKKICVSEEELLIIDFCKKWLSGEKTFILQTSGSTGTPKQITLTRTQMEASASATVNYFFLNKNQNAFICINTNYIGGIMMIVRALMTNMLMIIVAPTSNPFKDNYLELIPEISSPKAGLSFELDFAAFVPLQLQKILTETTSFGKIGINLSKPIIDNMKAIIVGGASLSETQENLFKTIVAPVFQTYGMTETVSHIALRRINPVQNTPKNNWENDCFEVLPYVKIRTDERGCLVISAPSTNFEEVITNDLVEIIRQDYTKQYFKFLGRIDNVINSGGVKIQLETVEKNIEKFFANEGLEDNFKKYSTKSYYCMGVPDNTLGQQLVVVFEGEKMSSNAEDSLKIYLEKHLNKYEIPKKILYKKAFKRTETGKIIRK